MLKLCHKLDYRCVLCIALLTCTDMLVLRTLICCVVLDITGVSNAPVSCHPSCVRATVCSLCVQTTIEVVQVCCSNAPYVGKPFDSFMQVPLPARCAYTWASKTHAAQVAAQCKPHTSFVSHVGTLQPNPRAWLHQPHAVVDHISN